MKTGCNRDTLTTPPRVWYLSYKNPDRQYAYVSIVKRRDSELWDLLKDKKPGKRMPWGKYVYWISLRGDVVLRSLKSTLRTKKKSARRRRGRVVQMQDWRKRRSK